MVVRFQHNISIVVILFSIVSCGQNTTEKETSMEDELLNYYKEVKYRDNPISYNASFYSNGCSFELRINDDYVYNYYKKGGVGTSFPVNPNILKSGIQTYSIKLFPPKLGKDQYADALPKDASFKLVIDANIFKPSGGVEVIGEPFEFITPTKLGKNEDGAETQVFADHGKPFVEYRGTFNATVPYDLKGWSESVDLRKEDPDKLLKEVIAFYQKAGNYLMTDSYEDLFVLFEDKIKERGQYFYNDSLGMIDELNIYKKYKDLENKKLIPLDDRVELKFFGNGKMVGLYDRSGVFKGDPSFQIDFNKTPKIERTKFIFLHLHRPEPGAPLEAIR